MVAIGFQGIWTLFQETSDSLLIPCLKQTHGSDCEGKVDCTRQDWVTFNPQVVDAQATTGYHLQRGKQMECQILSAQLLRGMRAEPRTNMAWIFGSRTFSATNDLIKPVISKETC